MIYLYIIFSEQLNRYYVGISEDPWLRLMQHNANGSDKYTGRAKDWALRSIFQVSDRSTAVRLERFIKRQHSRVLLERLCNPNYIPEGTLAQLVRVPQLRD